MLDYRHVITNQPVDLCTFVKNVKNSDITFCEAWEEMNSIPPSELTTPQGLLKTLDKIHDCSIRHLEVGRQGRAHRNVFGISKGYTTDEEGIKEIISKIWIDKADYVLQVLAEDNLQEAYVLKKNSFQFHNKDGKVTRIQPLSNDRSKTVALLFQKIIPCYHKGHCLGNERLVLRNHSSPAEREKVVLNIFKNFLEQIKIKDLSENERIEIVAVTMKDILQQHIYYDGNARSLFILANFLLGLYHSKPFYPKNICLFDANSKGKMIAEISKGQKRFVKMFGHEKSITENLKNYKQAVLNLQELINSLDLKPDNLDSLQAAYNTRNFNLLLRLSATLTKNLTLLKFLLENTRALNIDLNATGKSSGTVLDVAIKYKNQEAINLIENLKIYDQVVSDLKELINSQALKPNNLHMLEVAYQARNFNLLLRLSATITESVTLLKFLLKSRTILNIDSYAAGKSSGTALDIAIKNHNHKAIALLQTYQS